MDPYDREAERIRKLLDEVLTENVHESDYDDESEESVDEVEEQFENSESEQEVSDGEDATVISTDSLLFIGRDKLTKWYRHVPAKNVRTRSENIITHLPGVKPAAKQLKTPCEIWKHFFTDVIISTIVENSNLFIESQRSKFSRDRDCNITTASEIRAVIGLLYLAGMMKANHLNADELWKTDGTGVEIFRLTMSLSRFRFLLRHLRFDDKATRNERLKYDKLAPIRNIFDMFVQNCKTAYTPSEYLTIDEKLEAFRGKCRFRQYIPSKPNKYGLKIFALCDSKTYYCMDMEVYVGTQPEGPYYVSNTPAAVVQRLCTSIKGTGRNITVDNWFTSLQLVETLKNDFRLTLLGTIRKNKKELPLQFTKPNKRPQGSNMFAFRKSCTLVSYIPKKGKNVLLVSSLHHDDSVDEETGKAEMIVMYNKTKGGVDMCDKLCAVYNCARYTRRWPMVIFYSLLNVGGINSLVIHAANNPDSCTRRRDFLRQLSYQLVTEQVRVRAAMSNIPSNIPSKIGEIFQIEAKEGPTEHPNKQRGRCAYCDRRKNRPTRYSCCRCRKYLCLEHASVICSECSQKADSD